jgi:uncharacterized membrane protein YozB (DUF420 family)
MTTSDLPTLNACLNFTASVLLLSGWRAIRAGKKELHKKFMLSALLTSACFLASYLYYHFNVGAVTKFEGSGILRWIYFFILFTHIPLATLMVTPIFYVFIAALRGNFEKHKRWARWVLPIWLYVSVTGVLISFLLYKINVAPF